LMHHIKAYFTKVRVAFYDYDYEDCMLSAAIHTLESVPSMVDSSRFLKEGCGG
jgi:hypothetical protein